MSRKRITHKKRSWLLLFISSVLILFGLTLLALAIIYIADLGWWSLAVGLSGIFTTIMATLSILYNDPSWILLDLILPG